MPWARAPCCNLLLYYTAHAAGSATTARDRRARKTPSSPELMLVAVLGLVAAVAAESEPWLLKPDQHHDHHHPPRAATAPPPLAPPPPRTVPLAAPTAGDPLRVRTGVGGGGVLSLLPLQWGTVQPAGWIKDWAVTASHGAVSPTNAWFASGSAVGSPARARQRPLSRHWEGRGGRGHSTARYKTLSEELAEEQAGPHVCE